MSGLKTEWCLLQNQFDSYEKHSLYIKLASIMGFLVAEITSAVSIYIILILMILWLQDAIWKTFQSRIEARLLQIEKSIAVESKESIFQFNSEYQKTRLGGISLMIEYACQAIRPTVAFPHIALIIIMLFRYMH